MPTITLAAPRPPATGAAAKTAPTVLGIGEAGSPFAAILDGAVPEADPTLAANPTPGATPAAPGRQPVAVCGIVLPPTSTVAAPVVAAAVPAAMSPVATAIPVVVTAIVEPSASGERDKAAADEDDATPAEPPASDTPATPLAAIVMPSPAPIAVPIATPSPRGVKSSLPPAISVVATPLAATSASAAAVPAVVSAPPPTEPPAVVPPTTAPAPQVGRDMQWAVVKPAPPPSPAEPVVTVPLPVATPPASATPVLASLPPIVAGPALQVFGAAMSAAVHREKPEAVLLDPTSAAAPIASATAPVAAPAGADAQPMLDLRQERWPQAMVAHIERLRDAADATDTRIRLIPDALGTIDVAVKRDGDTVHVQFSADQAATRALLQDAQPKLAQIAEERGLRLGQTGVDGGAAGSTAQQRQPSPQPQRDATTSPSLRGATTTTEDTDAADTGRLA